MKLDDKRLEVLKQLLDREGKRWSVSELAEAADVSQPTTSRIVEELEEESIVKSSRKGNMKLVELERREHVQNIVKAVGEKHRPMREAAETFAKRVSKVEDVEKVVLFGSVARGTADFNSDVDLLVVVSGNAEETRERVLVKAETVSDETGFHISPTVMKRETYQEHESEESQFYRSVQQDRVVLYDQQTS
ncbi:MAG: nucleotidyltransferase domain-containing protein [Candidatus Nanohaloarchaea archaeon]|nr:nucleotidyltransferase domain-containing protein [Candidatus Nanohaloarchaea archaeon]